MYINPLLCYFLEPDAHCTLKLHKMQTTPPQTAHKGAQYSGKQHKWAERATTRANIGLKTLTPSIGVFALTIYINKTIAAKGFTSGLTITTPHSRSMPGGRSLSLRQSPFRPGRRSSDFPGRKCFRRGRYGTADTTVIRCSRGMVGVQACSCISWVRNYVEGWNPARKA